jgi:nitrogen PTS system EIIA component
MTMELGDILAADGIVPQLAATTKKQALEELAALASKSTGLDARELFNALQHRERLGSTGLGRGIAIPHVKFKSLKNIVCIFARLSTPVDFESSDGEPVDLLFLLLAPEHAGGDHLKALARISRLVREPATLDKLRNAPDKAALKTLLTQPAPPQAA